MSNIPTELKYSQTHEWIEVAHDGTGIVGITDHAQELLGDIVFVETPEAGSEVSREEPCAVVESVKAASDIYAILTGEIIEANEELADAPETINNNPYVDGWIYKIKIADESELDELMDADAYQAFIDDTEE